MNRKIKSIIFCAVILAVSVPAFTHAENEDTLTYTATELTAEISGTIPLLNAAGNLLDKEVIITNSVRIIRIKQHIQKGGTDFYILVRILLAPNPNETLAAVGTIDYAKPAFFLERGFACMTVQLTDENGNPFAFDESNEEELAAMSLWYHPIINTVRSIVSGDGQIFIGDIDTIAVQVTTDFDRIYLLNDGHLTGKSAVLNTTVPKVLTAGDITDNVFIRFLRVDSTTDVEKKEFIHFPYAKDAYDDIREIADQNEFPVIE